MTQRIEDYEYLWSSHDNRWVLEKVDEQMFVIFDQRSNQAVLIEDDELHAEVCRRMIAVGVPVMTRLPPSEYVPPDDT